MKVIIFMLLFLGCVLLFGENRWLYAAGELAMKTKWEIDVASRQRALERRKLRMWTEEKNFWSVLERELYYSGLKFYFPKLTPEYWLAWNMVVCALILTVASFCGAMYGVYALVLFFCVEKLIVSQMKLQNMKSVNEQLLKLLDFLGNYSITSGEVTNVLFQVSRYMEEPLKSVLEGCCYEAQTTGNVSDALRNMSQKIEHPQFKELVGNMEVSIRYCADFGALVSGSKRSMREYLKSSGERKGMLREAVISMLILLVMSAVILMTVGNLVQMSIHELLFKTMPGKIGVTVLVGVAVLFVTQLRKVHY